MGKKNKLPDGWLDYGNVGRRVPGTRFIAFKVPLKETICRNNLNKSKWFTPDILLETIPSLKLIVNLTNTVSGRYYDYQFFTNNGVEILPLKCEGRGTLPPNKLMNAFYGAVDDFLEANAADSDALIGVHCTHGLNRTGLFICKYMVERMGMPATEAIRHFQTARGHDIERHQYLEAIANSDATETQELVLATVKKESTAGKGKSKNRKQNVDGEFNEWCQRRQTNGYNKHDDYNYEENNYGYNNHRNYGYNNQRQNVYNDGYNKRQNGYNSQRQSGNSYRSQNQNRSRKNGRNDAHPYSRENSLTNRNSKREKNKKTYFQSPLDNCYN